MTTTAEKIEIMQAHEDGKDIEFKPQYSSKWKSVTNDNPFWDWKNSPYRIKPREPRVIYVTMYQNIQPAVHRSEEDAKLNFCNELAIGIGVKFIEVLEEE